MNNDSDTRRGFFKKSLTLSVVAVQPVLFVGIIRAAGGEAVTTVIQTTKPFVTTDPNTTVEETQPVETSLPETTLATTVA